MNKKKAFTLIELMVTLAIFSIVSVLLSAILLQGQRILTKVDNRTEIQNEVRLALLKIQTAAQNHNEVIINNKFGYFNGDQWVLDDSVNTGRELVRFVKKDEENAKVYAEINDGNQHQLIEFSVNKNTNIVIENSISVLINNIQGDDSNSIIVNVEEIKDTDGNKKNELVIINCSNIIKGSSINENEYLISFNKASDNIININVGSSNGSGNGSGNNGSGDSNESDNNGSNGSIDNNWEYDWIKDNIEIRLISTNSWGSDENPAGSWKVEIANEGTNDIIDWELTLTLKQGATLNAYNCIVDTVQNENKYKISSSQIEKNVISVNSYIQVADGNIYGQKIEDVNVEFKYKKVIKPTKEVIKLENGVKICLYDYQEVNVNGKNYGRWYMTIENSGERNINKWEIRFDKEKSLKGVSSGLIYNINDKIYNNTGNTIGAGKEIYIYFDTESGVSNRNIKNIIFNIIN